MARRRAEVYILTALLLVAAVVFGTREPWEKPAFSFRAGKETFQVWQREDGEGFVFVPSYVNLSDLKIQTSHPVSIGGAWMTYGKTCQNLNFDTTYPLSGPTKAIQYLTFHQTGALPSLFLDTASGGTDQLHADKTYREAAQLRLYNETGEKVSTIGVEYMKTRGNSTFLYQQKKAYSLKLTAPQDLLGMGAADKWILLANAYDDSQLRNKIVYDFAAQAGLPFSPESRFVDLYLNGVYAGLYQLTERNEIHPERVRIGGSGSFLVSVDRPWGSQDPTFLTASGTSIRVHQSNLEEKALKSLWQSVENAILAEDSLDSVTGRHLTDLIDLDSWVKKYLIEEVFSNTDGGRYSQFYYRDGTGKICAGPVWDYDLALSNPATYREFGDVGYRDSRYNMFYVNTNADSWFYHLYRKPFFQARVRELYAQDFLPLLKNLPETVTDYEALTAKSAQANAFRWNTPHREVQEIRSCITGRTEFLTQIWVENQTFIPVTARYVDRNIAYHLLPGETLSQLPAYPGYTWFYTGTDQPVDQNTPVTAPQSIELREHSNTP